MKYLKIFTDFYDAMEPLTNEEAGILFRAMLLYTKDGADPELSGNERYLWMVAKQHMDREAEAYAAKTEALRESGKKGAAARWDRSKGKDGKCHLDHGEDGQDNDKDKYNDKYKNNDKDNEFSFLPDRAPVTSEKKPVVKEEEKRERHPSLEDIEKYIQDAHLPVDGEHFYNYYQANGWIMGSQPMRDWKAALKAWARNAPVVIRPVQRSSHSTGYDDALSIDRILHAKHL